MRAPVLPQQDGAPAERVREAIDAIRRDQKTQPWTAGKAIADISIAGAGTTEVHHNLGHLPAGWFLTDVNGLDSRVSRTAWTTTTITLANSAAGTVTVAIWIW